MKNYFFILSLLFIFATSLMGQNRKYFYSFKDAQGISQVEFKVPAEVKMVEWESNYLLFEYLVSVKNIPRNIFYSLVETPRYQLEHVMNSDNLLVQAVPAAFKVFNFSSGQAVENNELVVYYPNEYEPSDGKLIRK